MKTAFLTDIHFNDKERLFMKSKRQAILKEFLNTQLEEDIQHVVFWGDIFDTVNVDMASESAAFFFGDIVKTLLERGVKVDILVGNHERLGKKNVYNLLDDGLTHPLLSIFKEVTYRLSEDRAEIFIPFLYPSDFGVETIEDTEKELKLKIEVFLKEIKAYNPKLPIVVYNHNCMWGTWFELEKEIDFNLTQFKDFDLVLGGHVHKHKELSEKCLYVGALMRSFVYENEDEGYYIFETVDQKIVNKEYRETGSFPYEKVTIYGDQEYTFIPGTIYNITFQITEGLKDKFFIANTVRRAEECGAFVLNYKYVNGQKIKRDVVSNVSNMLMTNEDILTVYLKEEGLKGDVKDYLKKLRYCSVKWAKGINEAMSSVSVEDIEEKKIRKTAKRLNKFEKKQKESVEQFAEKAESLVDNDFLL